MLTVSDSIRYASYMHPTCTLNNEWCVWVMEALLSDIFETFRFFAEADNCFWLHRVSLPILHPPWRKPAWNIGYRAVPGASVWSRYNYVVVNVATGIWINTVNRGHAYLQMSSRRSFGRNTLKTSILLGCIGWRDWRLSGSNCSRTFNPFTRSMLSVQSFYHLCRCDDNHCIRHDGCEKSDKRISMNGKINQ